VATTAVSIVIAVISLVGVVSVEFSRRRSAVRLQEDGKRRDAELEELKSRLTVQREAASKAEQAAELLDTYRLPVARACFDLQSRIYNIHQGFGGRRDPDYFRLNTMFLIAEFFGWLEIVRQEIQFLDPVTEAGGLGLHQGLDTVRDLFAETSHRSVGEDPFYIYRGEQRAIGELMIVETPRASGPSRQCRGYASFVSEMERPEFASWFERIGREVDGLRGRRSERFAKIQCALVDVLDVLDPAHVRFTRDRGKIDSDRGGD
jgi:hypothetical protein